MSTCMSMSVFHCSDSLLAQHLGCDVVYTTQLGRRSVRHTPLICDCATVSCGNHHYHIIYVSHLH